MENGSFPCKVRQLQTKDYTTCQVDSDLSKCKICPRLIETFLKLGYLLGSSVIDVVNPEQFKIFLFRFIFHS